MSELYKVINPVKYFNDYISCDIRIDRRDFDEQRDIKINLNSLKTAEASVIVKCGNTTVTCGIKLELAQPKAEEPNLGFLVTNVEMPPLCSPKFRPGPPSDHAQVTNNLVADIVTNSKCIDLKDLCIAPDKLVWVVYCDMICLDNDGSIVDACLISLMTCLKALTLPSVKYDSETEEIQVDTNTRTPLKIHGLPIAASFSTYYCNGRSILLNDPSAYEEEMCGGVGANLIISFNKGLLCGIHKFGGISLTMECQEKALKIAKQKYKIVEKLIETCLKNDTTEHLKM